MPLVLGLKEGEGFQVGDHSIKVARIWSETQFRLNINGVKFVEVDDQISKEVVKGVRVASGTRGQRTLARVAIEAPRSMQISRDTQVSSRRLNCKAR